MILGTILALKVAAEAVVNLTPTPKDDRFVGKFYKVVEAIAGIFGKTAKEFPNSREMKEKISEAANAPAGAHKRTDMSEVDAWLNMK
jgi:ABC-type enterochelin transport system substrate-binding protein